ncbi:hypothetical protein [Anianabacter salinae]|uniref:hypothetical protein n=1 Tax=Anianabacter salinae TaxID=2851023 RepID=UPI00225DEFF7|nr:hypothetical protein [Anianabacter salinae]MBV0914222.1 hypothetical protein [Anianabacter salinae]
MKQTQKHHSSAHVDQAAPAKTRTAGKLPWKVQKYGPGGALSPGHQRLLAHIFHIDASQIARLSKDLGHALDPATRSRSVITTLKQMERAPKEVDQVLKHLRRAESNLAKAIQSMQDLHVFDEDDPSWLSRWCAQRSDSALFDTQIARVVLNRRFKTAPESISFTGNPDRRRNADERRSGVLCAIFTCWSRSGHKLAITTDGVTSERKGPLMAFTKAVVRAVTNPSSEINSETAWKELEHFKRRDRFYNEV